MKLNIAHLAVVGVALATLVGGGSASLVEHQKVKMKEALHGLRRNLQGCSTNAGCSNVWQHCRYGTCTDCPRGEVQTPGAATGCQDCPDGEVRGTNKDGAQLADCIAPGENGYPCDLWEFARYGYCETCPKGEVGYPQDYKSCVDCPDGEVRGTLPDGTELADCKHAGSVCDLWQFARYGYCENCPKGEVGYLGGYKSCVDCPDGTVRGDSSGTADGYCVGPCPPWQFARYGYCENCPKGEVGYLGDFKRCVDCPDGSVRGTDAAGTELDICIGPNDAGYPCALWQFARYGYCEDCPKGEVGYLGDYRSCVDCPDGSVRGTNANGTEKADCIAPGESGYPCSGTQFARYGYCENCSAGQEANTAHTNCVAA